MRCVVSISFAMVLLAVPAAAQTMCTTKLGNCPIGGAVAVGGSCVCVTPSGPVQGVAGAGSFQSAVPGYCCTPSGRLPFPNTSIGPGQPCRAATPAGVAAGQACY